MYVISHGCLLKSYKAFNLHTWLCMSCDFTSSGCKYLFLVYVFFLWEASCYESCFVSTMFPSTAWWNYELLFRSQYCTQTSFFLNWSSPSSWWRECFAWCHCTHHIILFLWTVVTCSSEQVFILLCLRSFLQVQCIYMVRNISYGILILANIYA